MGHASAIGIGNMITSRCGAHQSRSHRPERKGLVGYQIKMAKHLTAEGRQRGQIERAATSESVLSNAIKDNAFKGGAKRFSELY